MNDHPEAQAKGRAVTTGWLVFGALAVLTVVEYIIAISLDANLPVIMVIAVLKAALIIYYFMHVARLWHASGEKA